VGITVLPGVVNGSSDELSVGSRDVVGNAVGNVEGANDAVGAKVAIKILFAESI